MFIYRLHIVHNARANKYTLCIQKRTYTRRLRQASGQTKTIYVESMPFWDILGDRSYYRWQKLRHRPEEIESVVHNQLLLYFHSICFISSSSTSRFIREFLARFRKPSPEIVRRLGGSLYEKYVGLMKRRWMDFLVVKPSGTRGWSLEPSWKLITIVPSILNQGHTESQYFIIHSENVYRAS